MSQVNMQKYPSMASLHSMASIGYLPPGHGYVPRKQKPEKPYGLSFTSVMNRTVRGPGRKYLKYAVVTAGAALLFFLGAGLYFGHRNVSRMNVYRTEVLGALMVVGGLLCVGIIGHSLYKARVESNKWRKYIRFHPEGMYIAAAVNYDYVPEQQENATLLSGTFGPKALKAIPKPKQGGKKSRSKPPSRLPSSTQDTAYEKPFMPQGGPQQHSSPINTLQVPYDGPYDHSSPVGTLAPPRHEGPPPFQTIDPRQYAIDRSRYRPTPGAYPMQDINSAGIRLSNVEERAESEI